MLAADGTSTELAYRQLTSETLFQIRYMESFSAKKEENALQISAVALEKNLLKNIRVKQIILEFCDGGDD